MGMEAVELFHRVPPSLLVDVTYVCVLNACSHAGLIDQARSIFASIEAKTEKHYAAMVIIKWPILLDLSKVTVILVFLLKIDCLNRGSWFDEARQLIDQYEVHHPPSPVMYSEYFVANSETGCTDTISQLVDRKESFGWVVFENVEPVDSCSFIYDRNGRMNELLLL